MTHDSISHLLGSAGAFIAKQWHLSLNGNAIACSPLSIEKTLVFEYESSFMVSKDCNNWPNLNKLIFFIDSCSLIGWNCNMWLWIFWPIPHRYSLGVNIWRSTFISPCHSIFKLKQLALINKILKARNGMQRSPNYSTQWDGMQRLPTSSTVWWYEWKRLRNYSKLVWWYAAIA